MLKIILFPFKIILWVIYFVIVTIVLITYSIIYVIALPFRGVKYLILEAYYYFKYGGKGTIYKTKKQNITKRAYDWEIQWLAIYKRYKHYAIFFKITSIDDEALQRQTKNNRLNSGKIKPLNDEYNPPLERKSGIGNRTHPKCLKERVNLKDNNDYQKQPKKLTKKDYKEVKGHVENQNKRKK